MLTKARAKEVLLTLCDYRWAQPILSALALLFPALLSHDNLLETYLGKSFIAFLLVRLIYDVFRSWLLHPSIKELEVTLQKSESKNKVIGESVKNLFNGYLCGLSKKLDFSSFECKCERVTICIHNRNSYFVPFGRFSENPEYRKPGRSQYPDNQGCIAKGWRNGWHFENSLGEGEEYEENSKKMYRINKKTLNSLTMKSKLYAVHRVNDNSGKSLAVVVVESMNAKGFDEKKLKDHLEKENDYIAELIVNLKDHIPNLSTAKESEF